MSVESGNYGYKRGSGLQCWFRWLFCGLLREYFEYALLPKYQVSLVEPAKKLWHSHGDNPQIQLKSKDSRFPQGWVIIQSRLVRRGTDYTTRLFVDTGSGVKRKKTISIPVFRSGKIEEVIHLPRDITGMVWVPMASAGEFEQELITITRIGFIERGYRMLLRTVSIWWAQKRERRKSRELSLRNIFLNLPAAYRAAGALLAYGPSPTYREWVHRYGVVTHADRAAIREHLRTFHQAPLISIILRVNNTSEKDLRRTLDSLLRQLYPHWELGVSIGAIANPDSCRLLEGYQAREERIKLLFREGDKPISDFFNRALDLAAGKYVMVLGQGDELAEHALYHVAVEANSHPDVGLLYADEDKIDAEGVRFHPHFKPDWNPDLFYSQNYLSNFCVYRVKLVREAGGFSAGNYDHLDYDLSLRCVDRTQPGCIRHLPVVLYHRRVNRDVVGSDSSEGQDTGNSCVGVLRKHFRRSDSSIEVLAGHGPGIWRVRYPLPELPPKALLIIPTRDRREFLGKCVESILEKTTYPNYGIIVVDNQSADGETLRYLGELKQDARIEVLQYDHPFNYAAITNLAARQAGGEVIALVNNDVEVISPDWLTEMVSQALRPGIGAVGAKLYYGNGTVQHAGVVLGLRGVADHAHKYYPGDAEGYFGRLQSVQNVSAVTGACLVVRRAVFEQVGGMDAENLAVAFNDVDLCLRIREAGYRNLWTPYAELYHHESVSRGVDETGILQSRMRSEADWMRKRWGKVLERDPYYSPYLTLQRTDFSLAPWPRVDPPWWCKTVGCGQ